MGIGNSIQKMLIYEFDNSCEWSISRELQTVMKEIKE